MHTRLHPQGQGRQIGIMCVCVCVCGGEAAGLPCPRQNSMRQCVTVQKVLDRMRPQTAGVNGEKKKWHSRIVSPGRKFRYRPAPTAQASSRRAAAQEILSFRNKNSCAGGGASRRLQEPGSRSRPGGRLAPQKRVSPWSSRREELISRRCESRWPQRKRTARLSPWPLEPAGTTTRGAGGACVLDCPSSTVLSSRRAQLC